jgi:tetracycline 7-halogenase / FADH2 O2-dependent halogenase
MAGSYDVVIIGSGIAGTMLGSILAKNGIRTLILDSGTHPRFAVGESMVPESGTHLKIMAEMHGIPELAYVGDPRSISTHIGSSAAGIKLAFSFAWNEPGREHDPAHVVAPPLLVPEAHLFRQDIDAYYLSLAAKLGAEVRQQTMIDDLAFDDSGVRLTLRNGETIDARYVVDAAGYRSPVADKLGLRKDARPMQSQTCSLFTHMVGVRKYEDLVQASPEVRAPMSLSQSTLHHICDEGWFWVIPFDNHPKGTNTLCSVGLQYNLRKYKPTGTPEEEFRRFLDKYPTVARHFDGAARVREWTYAPRLNYTSRETVGDRYCLLAHAAGFVDPLFSRGLVNTFESINRLAPKLIRAARNDRWKREDFASFEAYSLEVVRVNDRLVANSFEAFTSFPLWNAWHRIWISGSHLGNLRLAKLLHELRTTGDKAALEHALEQVRHPGHLSLEFDFYETMFDTACDAMEAFTRGEASEQDTIDILQGLYRANRHQLPPIDYANLSNRFVAKATQAFCDGLVDWSNNAPEGMRPLLAGRPYMEVDFHDDYRYDDRNERAAAQDRHFETADETPA